MEPQSVQRSSEKHALGFVHREIMLNQKARWRFDLIRSEIDDAAPRRMRDRIGAARGIELVQY